MLIQRLLQLLGLAIVAMVAVMLLGLVLRLAVWVLKVGAWVLVVLMVVAAALRLVELVQEKRDARRSRS